MPRALHKDSAVELAEKMVHILESQRSKGADSYLPTLKELAELADPQASPELIARAINKTYFKDHVWAVFPNALPSPVVLAIDSARMAADPRTLEGILEALCTPEAPLWPVARIIGRVKKEFRQPLQEAVSRQIQEQTLPATIGVRLDSRGPQLYLQRLRPPPPPKKPAALLAEKLLQGLEAQRRLVGPRAANAGGTQYLEEPAYPLTLQRLRALADAVSDKLFKQALAAEPFKSGALLAKLDKTTSLVALAGDRALLAGDPRLLLHALQAVYPKKKAAAQSMTRIAAKVAPDLRQAFEEAIHRQIQGQTLPARVGVLDVDGAAHLYLRDRPPEVVAAADLAAQLLRTLQAERDKGPDHYPPTLARLVEMVAPQSAAKVLKKALGSEALQQEIVLAVPRNPETPVALRADVDRLAGSRQLLEFVLACAGKPAVKAFPVKDLQKQLTEILRRPFADAVNLNSERGKLPPTVGCLWIKTRYLFLTRDVLGSFAGAAGQMSGENAAPEQAVDFPGAFAAAFEQLDRQAGGHNFVSLVELRRALPVPRAIFDAELFKLRQAGRYSLSAAEGRHGISAEEQDAGLHEEGSLLLFVSRNLP